ncbi:phage-related baseplate assembly protein [Nitrosomonas oligotropha]|uniref:Phage-related baseplate assembly protein n=1 Tax=Nitrosomonas oligotropha TaxID=42354 RepID=A0A2T5HGZ4_9PROT|nr:baseplate J/gp47 family protein [Nitrosomonas oligotropha]PTQ70850.1 phage-related baseplate assembly protein [Nitrosomonas oligotropha]
MTTIDLTKIPAPDVVEALDFEEIYQEILAGFKALYPDWTAALESDPVVKLLELATYRETLLRARVNDAARACMLAYATGGDLENLSALLGVTRLVSGNDAESDDRLRLRAQMALEGVTVAGSHGSYVFHSLSASNLVKDVAVDSPDPGEVRVTILSTEGDGTPDEELIDAVDAYLSAETRRPLTDSVSVETAEIVTFAVTATLQIYPGPASAPILAAAQAAVQAYVLEHAKLGMDVTLSGLYAALHQPGGVKKVVLASPLADVTIGPRQASHCTGITLTAEVVTDG